MKILTEDKRRELVAKGKIGKDYVPSNRAKGRNRYARRVHSKVANSVKEFNSINMNDLFKKDILNVDVNIAGETDNYQVKISFRGFIDRLKKELQKNNKKLELKDVIRALIESFNQDDVYLSCNCPDFFYRFGYWTTKNNTNSGTPQNIPSDITNPDDLLGSGCKHALLVIANNSWMIKVASVIYNYINYIQRNNERAYKKLIYPTIYGKPYEEPEQLSLFKDEDELETDKETISKSNVQAVDRGRFKKGNKQGIRFAKDKEDQMSLDDLEQ